MNNSTLPPSPTSDDGDSQPHNIHDNENIELSIGDIIWLKLESYPWWPAKIVDDNDSKIPSSVLKAKKQSDLKLVKFFNSSPSEEYYWIDINNNKDIKLFKSDPYLLDNNITAIKNNPNLKKAIQQAKQLCGLELPIIHNSNNNNNHSNNNNSNHSNNVNEKKRKNESEEESENKKKKDLVILTDEELNSIKEELSKSIETNNNNDIKHYLNFIHDKCNEITVDQLKTCKIGQVVAQLRKHSEESISKMAKDLVKTWTSLISNNSTTSSNNTSTTTNTTVKTTTTTSTPNTPKKSSSSNSTTTTTNSTTATDNDNKPKIKKVVNSSATTTAPTTTTTKATTASSTTTSTTTTGNTSTTTTTKQPLAIKPIKTSSSSSSLSSTGSLKSPTTPLTPGSISLFDSSKIPQCSESNRNRWRQKIGEGLFKVPNSNIDRIVELCVEIESCVFNYFKTLITATPTSYDDHCRTLTRNLNASNNDDFRSNVYHSLISIEQLPIMKVQDMASKEKQKENALLQERKLHGSMVAKPAAVESSMFRCGKCKKTQCTFYEMQTRSADEPMTAFITCLSCGNRWKQ